MSGYANGILLPQLADDLADGKRGPISVAFSMATIMVAIISPAVGRLADQWSPKKLLLIGAASIALSHVAVSTATEMWHLYFAKGALLGVGITLAGPLVRNLVVARWFDRMRGRALGFSVLGVSFAGVTLPLIMNELVNTLGWRGTVMIFAVAVALLLLPTIYLFLKDQPEDIGEVPDGSRTDTSTVSRPSALPTIDSDRQWTYIELFQSKAFWATGLIFGPMMCVYLAIIIHLFGHAVSAGLSTEQAALVLTMVATTSLIGKPAIGFMADYFGSRLTLWLSLGLQGAALLVFTISSELWHFLIAAAMFGFGYSALSSMRTYVLSTNIGIRSLGTSLGLLKWLEFPFAVTASPIAGYVYDATGSYNQAFFVFACFIGLACLGPLFIADNRAPKQKALA